MAHLGFQFMWFLAHPFLLARICLRDQSIIIKVTDRYPIRGLLYEQTLSQNVVKENGREKRKIDKLHKTVVIDDNNIQLKHSYVCLEEICCS